ncbi:hypothetical protein BJV78DRAFT_1207230 [Lactifluus subvellereus]|nr:hypothetical protein BJV78DRAFT_1207230 [Lactifluus subvellereus]
MPTPVSALVIPASRSFHSKRSPWNFSRECDDIPSHRDDYSSHYAHDRGLVIPYVSWPRKLPRSLCQLMSCFSAYTRSPRVASFCQCCKLILPMRRPRLTPPYLLEILAVIPKTSRYLDRVLYCLFIGLRLVGPLGCSGGYAKGHLQTGLNQVIYSISELDVFGQKELA